MLSCTRACYMHATRGAATLLPLPTFPASAQKSVRAYAVSYACLQQSCTEWLRSVYEHVEGHTVLLHVHAHAHIISIHAMMLIDIQHYLKVL